MKPGRIPCSVPFCGRTASRERFPDASEIICGKHWRMADKKVRRFKTKADRAYERADARCKAIEAEGYEFAKAQGQACVSNEIMARFNAAFDERIKARARCARAWARCKRQIIERAMGVA